MTDRLFEAISTRAQPKTLNRAVVACDNLTTNGMVLWHEGDDLSNILDPDLDPGSESLDGRGTSWHLSLGGEVRLVFWCQR